jgi:hypothetical protein
VGGGSQVSVVCVRGSYRRSLHMCVGEPSLARGRRRILRDEGPNWRPEWE